MKACRVLSHALADSILSYELESPVSLIMRKLRLREVVMRKPRLKFTQLVSGRVSGGPSWWCDLTLLSLNLSCSTQGVLIEGLILEEGRCRGGSGGREGGREGPFLLIPLSPYLDESSFLQERTASHGGTALNGAFCTVTTCMREDTVR